jgi:hypothetical protein
MTQNISIREWLNSDGSSSTGSIVCFHGKSSWANKHGEQADSTFIEIADCHVKARLHRSEFDTLDDFITKLNLLRSTLDRFHDELIASQSNLHQ